MIPYNASLDFNKYCLPMKLYEYFYIGIPVISTLIIELKQFPNFVNIGSSVQEWITVLNNILPKTWNKSLQKEQKRIATNNSWVNKLEVISTIKSFDF